VSLDATATARAFALPLRHANGKHDARLSHAPSSAPGPR
jgi:hypothetical protein